MSLVGTHKYHAYGIEAHVYPTETPNWYAVQFMELYGGDMIEQTFCDEGGYWARVDILKMERGYRARKVERL